MHPLILIIQIFTGIFAVLGMYEFIRHIFDIYVMRRSGAKCRVLVCKCEKDVEYAVRFAESRFVFGEFADFFDGVVLSEDVDVSADCLEVLCREFGNVRK